LIYQKGRQSRRNAKNSEKEHSVSHEQRAERCGKNEAAIRLLEKWLADDSGYDEEVWPRVKAAIEENRLSDRKRFTE
jgi:hypothetical protein